LARSREITRRNLTLLRNWVDTEPRVSMVTPEAGTTALLRVHSKLGSEALCLHLLEQAGVMFTPGAAMGMEGYVRIGFANHTHILEEGLARTSGVLAAL
ncbi:MAG: aminotransferase class I/II-fold pyridoxal phosphate-dependent enzyme, partial [Shimia sp.]